MGKPENSNLHEDYLQVGRFSKFFQCFLGNSGRKEMAENSGKSSDQKKKEKN